MSNELRSVHEIPPNGDPVPMGECPDCHKDWFMTAREHSDWEKLIKEKRYHWPKRCQTCRSKRKSKAGTSLADILVKVQAMAKKAINEEYDGDSDRLAQELTDLTTDISAAMMNRANQIRVHEEMQKAVRERIERGVHAS